MPSSRVLIPAAAVAAALAVPASALATYPGTNAGQIVLAHGAYDKGAKNTYFVGQEDLIAIDPLVKTAALPAPLATPTKAADEFEPTYSPNGRWLAYVAGGKSKAVRGLWVISTTGASAPVQLSTDAVDAPAWSPDGLSIAYTTKAGLFTLNVGRKLYVDNTAYAPSPTPRRVVKASGKTSVFVPAYLGSDRLIYTQYDSAAKRQDSLQVLDLATLKSTSLFPGKQPFATAQQVDVSPDQKHLAFVGFNGKSGKKLVSSLYVSAADGSSRATVYSAKRDYLNGPVWSPAGDKIAVVQEGTSGKKPTDLKLFSVPNAAYANAPSTTLLHIAQGGLLYPSWQPGR